MFSCSRAGTIHLEWLVHSPILSTQLDYKSGGWNSQRTTVKWSELKQEDVTENGKRRGIRLLNTIKCKINNFCPYRTYPLLSYFAFWHLEMPICNCIIPWWPCTTHQLLPRWVIWWSMCPPQFRTRVPPSFIAVFRGLHHCWHPLWGPPIWTIPPGVIHFSMAPTRCTESRHLHWKRFE